VGEDIIASGQRIFLGQGKVGKRESVSGGEDRGERPAGGKVSEIKREEKAFGEGFTECCRVIFSIIGKSKPSAERKFCVRGKPTKDGLSTYKTKKGRSETTRGKIESFSGQRADKGTKSWEERGKSVGRIYGSMNWLH